MTPMKVQSIRPSSRARVMEEIQALQRAGEPLNGQRMIRHQTLYGHARRLFGSWEKAVRACGLDYGQIVLRRLWTKESILEWIRTEWNQKHDIRPGITKKRHSGVFNAALREFGSWYAAIRKAGIRSFPEVKFQRWSKERVLGAIAKMEAVPSPKDILLENSKLQRAAAYYFGTWTRAVREAGRECPLGWEPKKWTRERILDILKERRSAGRGPQSTAFKYLGAFVRAASMHFGGWRNAVKAAGFSAKALSPSRYTWSRNEIRSVIRHREEIGQSNHAPAGSSSEAGPPLFEQQGVRCPTLPSGRGKRSRSTFESTPRKATPPALPSWAPPSARQSGEPLAPGRMLPPRLGSGCALRAGSGRRNAS